MKLLTFLICTRNGAATLAECIAHIGRQQGISHDAFEIIVVDNGSTDGSAGIARAALAELPCDTAFVVEPREGKVNALLRGVRLSAAPYVAVVDDDTMIAEGFAFRTLQLFAEFAQLGMVGSANTLEAPEMPDWFPLTAKRYACGEPYLDGEVRTIDEHRTIASFGVVPGAGSTFRKEALLRALGLGFYFWNDTVRSGGTAAGGEDLELCYLLQHCGYWFGFDRRITLRHRINPTRLTWPYARRLSRGVGASGLVFDAFIWMKSGHPVSRKGTWWWLAARRVRRLAKMLPTFLSHRKQVSREVLNWETELGGLIRLCRERGDFTRRMQEMKSSRWARELHNSRAGLGA